MKYTSLLAILLAAGHATAATPITETFTMSTAVLIPDGDLSGVLQTITPSTTITSVQLLTMTLSTNGGWNGDLYAYLWHDGKLSVLVNRVGRTVADPAGSPTSGMTLSLADAAASDVHLASSFTGSFQPDGRAVAPSASLDTSPRTTAFADFIGSPASGDWRLFIADTASGDAAGLTGWSISITGEPIPEPSTAGLLLLCLAAVGKRKRQC